MKRTTIEAEESLLLELKQLAQERKTTTSRVIREALAAYVVENRPKAKPLSFTGIGASGYADVSERAEEILAEDAEKARGWGQ